MTKDNKHHDHNSMTKIFKIALILFATTFGIGVYALIGAPIYRLSSSPALTKIGNIVNKANMALVGVMSDSFKKDNRNNGEIKIKLERPDADLHKIKMTLIDTPFDDDSKRIVTLIKNDKEVSIPEFINYVSDMKPSESLVRSMNGSRYYMTYRDKEYKGTIVIPVIDNDVAFAGVIDWESKFADNTLPLVRPLLSQSDIQMYKELKIVTRNISGIDSRVIIGANDNILYIWGIHKNNLIISSNKDDYSKIVSILDVPTEKK